MTARRMPSMRQIEQRLQRRLDHQQRMIAAARKVALDLEHLSRNLLSAGKPGYAEQCAELSAQLRGALSWEPK